MELLELTLAEIIGSINITVFKTDDGDNFFQIQTNTEKLLSLLDILEDILMKY